MATPMTTETALAASAREAAQIRAGLFLAALQRLEVTLGLVNLAARLVEIERCIERRPTN